MIARNVTRETLETAASAVGVVAEIDTDGNGFRVKLFPYVPQALLTPAGRRKKRNGLPLCARYQRTSVSYFNNGNRIVNAVCWHGFRDFFRAVYAREPEAVFRTAIATWKGSDDFEERHQETAYRNVGPPIAPVAMQDACVCGTERDPDEI